jgi:hypothetical protein
MDSIVTLLTAANSQSRDEIELGTSSCPSIQASPSQSTPSPSQDTQVTSLDELSIQLGCPNPVRKQSAFRLQLSHQTSGSPAYDFNLGTEEADVLLTGFRINMAHHIPFVIIPPFLTSNDLGRDKAVLWKAVMVATARTSRVLRLEVYGRRLHQNIFEGRKESGLTLGHPCLSLLVRSLYFLDFRLSAQLRKLSSTGISIIWH